MSIIRLENLLKSGGSSRLEEIVQTAKDMGDLTQALKDCLEGELAASLVSASVRDQELTIMCTSSAWAARLRFETDQLLAAATDCGADAKTCQVRVSR